MSDRDFRKEFLLHMYDQLWNSINIRITGIWQCIGVLAGAFFVLSLVEKNIVPSDIAVSLIVLMAGWLLWNVQDASYWYNRNLCIVANIEKQMCQKTDMSKIHHYMGEHRKQKMISHLWIQCALGIGIIIVFMLYQLIKRTLPSFACGFAWQNILCTQSLPYAVLIVVIVAMFLLKRDHNRKYKEFLEKSPGIWAEEDKS